MKKTKLQFILFMLGSIVLFYLIPTIAPLMISRDMSLPFVILTLLIVNPIYSFLSGYIFTKDNGFKWYYSLMIGIIFIPAVFIIYNSSAAVYAIVYSALSYLGCLISIVTMKLKNN